VGAMLDLLHPSHYLVSAPNIIFMKNFPPSLICLSIGLALSFQASGQYCTAGPSSTFDSNVESVMLTGETTTINYTGCPGVAGVEDQTSLSADLKTGYSYTASVQFGTCGGNYAGVGEVWIDFNNDNVFDPSESIGQSSGTPGTAPWDAPVVFNFVVPAGAVMGATGMRVMQWEGGSLPLNPCGTYLWGSVVDFSITIAYGTTCSGVTGLVSGYIGLDSVNVSWTAGPEVGWNFELGNDGFTPGTGAAVYSSSPAGPTEGVSGLTMGTDYDIYVQADCSADSSQWVGPLDVTTILTCPSPSGLAGLVLSYDSIALSWSPGDSNETEWVIQYGITGFTPGTGISMVITGTPADTAIALTGTTTYDFYVKGVCGAADSSFWVGPVSLMTMLQNDLPCLSYNLPVDGVERLFSNAGATASPEEASLVIPAGTGASSCQSTDGWCSFELSITQAMWFNFIAPTSGNVKISCTGTSYDGQIAVFSGSDCNDIPSMTLLYANDDSPSGGLAPELIICGLDSGQTYYIMHDEYNGQGDGTIAFELSNVPTNAGMDASMDVCETDTVDLFSILTDAEPGGTFSFLTNPFALVNDTTFDATIIPDGPNDVYYIISNACATDTSIATVIINELASTGTAISPFDACNDGPVSLWDGLTGSVELGGTWNDDTGTGMLSGSIFLATGLPDGTYQFTYSVNNGICPASSTTVTVSLSSCNGIKEHPDSDFTIFPNPNQGSFYIRNNGLTNNFMIQVRDIGGRLVYSRSKVMSGSEALNLILDVETGAYLLSIRSDQGLSTYKVILE